MKKTTTTLLLLLLLYCAQAQTSFSLKDCINYGLNNHLSVRVYQNNIAKTKAQVQENYSSYLPQISGSAQLPDNVKLQTTVLPAGVFGADQTAVKFGTRYNPQASLEADQTIYDQNLLTGFKELKPGIEIAKLNAAQNDENIIYNISYYYYQVMVSKKQLELLHESASKYEKLIPITRLQIEKGVSKEVDLSRIQVSLNNTLSQISQAQNNYDLMLNRLKNAMGSKMEEQLVIQDSIADNSYAPIAAISDEPFSAENRADYKSQALNASIQDIEIRRIRAGYAPKLSFYIQYGAQSYGNDFAASFKSWYDFSALGLKLQVPIFDGLNKRARTKEAKLTFDSSLKNLELSKQSDALEYLNSKTQLQRNTDNVENDKQNINLAREVLNNTTLQYQQGVASLTELLNAEISFKEAETNLVNSLLNFYLAKLDLEKSKGTLKNYYQTL